MADSMMDDIIKVIPGVFKAVQGVPKELVAAIAGAVAVENSKGVSGEAVAAISGAVALLCGENAAVTDVKPAEAAPVCIDAVCDDSAQGTSSSHRAASGARSAWSAAGLAQVTKPFI